MRSDLQSRQETLAASLAALHREVVLSHHAQQILAQEVELRLASIDKALEH